MHKRGAETAPRTISSVVYSRIKWRADQILVLFPSQFTLGFYGDFKKFLPIYPTTESFGGYMSFSILDMPMGISIWNNYARIIWLHIA